MSIQLTTQRLSFTKTGDILNYGIKIVPATDSLKITVEGNYEIALGNGSTPIFGKELILLPDTQHVPYKIDRTIFVRANANAAEGAILHSSPINPDKISLALTCTLPATPPPAPITSTPPPLSKTPPKSPSPPSLPNFQFSKTELRFKSQPLDVSKVETLQIQTQAIPSYTVSTESPYSLSKDGKTFLPQLALTAKEAADKQTLYIKFLPTQKGTFNKVILFKTPTGLARQIRLVGEGKVASPNPLATLSLTPLKRFALPLAIALLLGSGIYWLSTRKSNPEPSRVEVPETPATAPTPKSTTPIIAVSQNDPACKPSLYQKLKEKTTVIRYACVSADCDTNYVRDILMNASGSKAFQYVNVHKKGQLPQACGAWIEDIFKQNQADLLYSDKDCDLNNIDKSHSLCDNQETQGRCAFLLPCGNSEGMLKVLNREIRKRKAKMNILEQ